MDSTLSRLVLGAVLFACALGTASPASAATTYLVTNLGDTNTPGTLRFAITQANANNTGTAIDPHQIQFLTGGGTITVLGAALPVVTVPAIIDGTTAAGYAGAPVIRLDAFSQLDDGLVVGAGTDGGEIRGLALTNFNRAIDLQGSATVTGNYIGLDPSGNASVLSANDIGVRVGATAGSSIQSNVVSNNRVGISDVAGGGAQIDDNSIGTDPSGTLGQGNSEDGVVSGIVAGVGPAISGNTISGSGDDGIDAEGGAASIVDNRIGTDAAGTAAIANAGSGVEVSGPVTAFGGANLGNTISGNLDGGVVVDAGAGSPIRGNLIGVGSDGVTPIPNLGSGGVLVSSALGGNTIGSTTAGEQNVIAYNAPWGVRVTTGTGNAIRGNPIFANLGLGIDLGAIGVLANDPGDGDGGANLQQNSPVVTSATPGNASGRLDSTASGAFGVDLFLSATCDPSGSGQGTRYVGSTTATADAGGNATFSVALPAGTAVGDQVTATATSVAGGNTSEFSACRSVALPTAPAPATGGGQPPVEPPLLRPAARGPNSNIKRIAGSSAARKLKRFSGTASDPDGDLARVEIAVVRVAGGGPPPPNQPKRCHRLQRSGKLKMGKPGTAGRCRVTAFQTVKGGANWTFTLKRRLPRGRYVVYSRAVDRTGSRETSFTRSGKNRRAFVLRGPDPVPAGGRRGRR